MKNETGHRIKLGIFISIGAILFFAAIYFIGNRQQMFSSTFHIKGKFKDVSGLEIGNNVRFAGITVGTVNDIAIISDTLVSVDMIISRSTRKFIKKDAKVIISSDGLMGNKIINIAPGSANSKEIENNDEVATTRPVNLDDIMVSIKVTSDNAARITNDLADVIGNVHDGKGPIGRLFMDTVMGKNLAQTLVNVKQGANGFKENMEAAKSNFLLKGYYKKKEKVEAQKKKDAENGIIRDPKKK